jgi:hypothetical protein
MPKLVEDMVPKVLPLGSLQKVLQNLLEEDIAIRDMRTIIETLAETATRTQDVDALTAQVRIALGAVRSGPSLARRCLAPDHGHPRQSRNLGTPHRLRGLSHLLSKRS